MNSNVAHHGRWLAIAAVCVGMAACGGGSGSSTATGSSSATSSGAGTATSTGSTPVASSTKGVFTGYTPSGTDNIGGDGGGGGTGGDGGGDGGFGVGGSLGRIQGATVIVTLADGTELGRAAVDAQGMVTVKPGTDYTGPLLVEMRGSDGAAYYDEARQSNLPYTEPDSLRMALSKPSSGLVVVTPLTNAAVRLLETQVGSSALLSSDAAITSANQTVVDQINSVLPDKLKIASIIGPATLVDSTTPANSLGTTAADLYARALAALAEATNLFNPGIAKPAAAFSESFGNDMTDGIVNGVDAANEPIGGDAGLGYDVGTLASNLQTGAAIADQRYSTPAVAVTPAPTAAICPATYDQGGRPADSGHVLEPAHHRAGGRIHDPDRLQVRLRHERRRLTDRLRDPDRRV
ncbi:MAG: hypothetical protein R3E83_23800 [Burkholderiaceae bacterium]